MEGSRISKLFEVSSKIRGAYEVFSAGDLMSLMNEFASNSSNIFIIDKKVAELFAEYTKVLELTNRVVYIVADEHNKTMDYAQSMIRDLIKLNIRKNNTIVAIGGGITQDLTAYISSILFRGVDWVFIPTTLLSQCDSCIGSKSSINFDQYKNLIGTFNPPVLIYISPVFLDGLSESEIRSGIGEMLHYFFSESIDLANKISERFEEFFVNRQALSYFITNSLRIKKAIIEVDEFDTSIRHIFNYGHTFGHAIEAITEYAIPHGQAICIGMDLANFISLRKGILSEDDFESMHKILELNIPSFKIEESNYEQYKLALSRDKKNQGDKLGCILSKGPGKLEKIYTSMNDEFKSIVLAYFKLYQN